MKKKIVALLLVVVMVFGVSFNASPSKAARFSNSKSKITLRVGAVYTLRDSAVAV